MADEKILSDDNRANSQKEKIKEIHHWYYQPTEKNFNLGSFFVGLLALIIGLIYLAKNIGWLKIDFDLEWKNTVPILLIAFGLSMISCRGLVATLIGVLITIVILGLVVAAILGMGDFSFI